MVTILAIKENFIFFTIVTNCSFKTWYLDLEHCEFLLHIHMQVENSVIKTNRDYQKTVVTANRLCLHHTSVCAHLLFSVMSMHNEQKQKWGCVVVTFAFCFSTAPWAVCQKRASSKVRKYVSNTTLCMFFKSLQRRGDRVYCACSDKCKTKSVWETISFKKQRGKNVYTSHHVYMASDSTFFLFWCIPPPNS